MVAYSSLYECLGREGGGNHPTTELINMAVNTTSEPTVEVTRNSHIGSKRKSFIDQRRS